MKNAIKKFLGRAKQGGHQKQVNTLSAEQIQKRDHKRDVVKNKLYPLLLENSKNIEDAKMFIESVAWVIRTQFDNGMKKMKLSELGLINELSKETDPKERERHEKILALFDQETISDTLEMISKMPDAIDSFVRKSNSMRQLSELEADFL